MSQWVTACGRAGEAPRGLLSHSLLSSGGGGACHPVEPQTRTGSCLPEPREQAGSRGPPSTRELPRSVLAAVRAAMEGRSAGGRAGGLGFCAHSSVCRGRGCEALAEPVFGRCISPTLFRHQRSNGVRRRCPRVRLSPTSAPEFGPA